MKVKRRRIDVVSTSIFGDAPHEEQSTGISFNDILSVIDSETATIKDIDYTFRLLETTSDGYKIGLVETMQSKDLPPKCNISTREYSSLPVDLNSERLAYANIFLYDELRNILLYEVNKNGCFIGTFQKCIQQIWERRHSNSEQLNLSFPTVLRRNAYEEVVRMNYYKKIVVEIMNPAEIIRQYNFENDSLNNGIRHHLERSVENNANVLKLEQSASTLRLNPRGLDRGFIRRTIDVLRTLPQNNTKTLAVTGYSEDPEGRNRVNTIDLVGSTFNKLYFSIPEQFLQADLQVEDRRVGIYQAYIQILSEIRDITGID